MFGFSIRTRQNAATDSPRSTGSPGLFGSSPRPSDTPGGSTSPKTEVGEVDTKAPFQSVRAALSLFVEPGGTPKSAAALHKRSNSNEERVLEKETQHHMILKELDSLKEQLRSTEATRSQALRELDRANRTLEKLTNKLETLSESKQTAYIATEAAKKRHKELEELKSSKAQIGGDAWKADVDNVRDQYKASNAELISAKQELANLRQDFDAALEAKLAAFHEAVDAQHETQLNQERAGELSTELSTVRETLGQVKSASLQAQEEKLKVIAETEAQIHSHKMKTEEIERRSLSLRKEFESGLDENFEDKLEETNEAITVLQEELNTLRASDQNYLRTVTSELEDAKMKLEEILYEENSVQSPVDTLKWELDNMKRERYEVEKAALEAESAAESLQFDLQNGRNELAGVTAEERTSKDTFDETNLSIEQLSAEANAAREEATMCEENIELLKQEAETAQLSARQLEEQLAVALKEAKEAKAAEKIADDQIHNSPRTGAANATNSTNSESSGKIKLSVEEYEALHRKVEQLKSDADMKVATASAQAESVRASERDAVRKLDANLKENEELKASIEASLKQAEMAEAAKKVVEGELRKWREKELNGPGESSSAQEGTS